MEILKGDGKAVIIAFIGVIVAVAMIASVANQTNAETNTFSVANDTITLPSTANSTVDLTGRSLVTGTTARTTNNSLAGGACGGLCLINGTSISSNRSTTTGLLTVQLFINDSGNYSLGTTANVSYDYIPDGYVGTVAGRSITSLIVLFSAIAIIVFSLVTFIKTGTLGRMIGRN